MTEKASQRAARRTHQGSMDFVVKRLELLTDDERDWLMRRTAEGFLFKSKKE